MSFPYEPEPGPTGPPETPQGLLARLLSRALNSFELSDGLLLQLDSAVAHDSSLHSALHSSGLHRVLHRHTWLLRDGSICTLWELIHNTAPPGRHDRVDQHELYADSAHLKAAMTRLPLPLDEPTDFGEPLTEPFPAEPSGTEAPFAEAALDPDGTRPDGTRPDGPVPEETSPDGFPLTEPLSRLPLPRHVYIPDNSADHARRLLRRAENQDRPDTTTLLLLSTALAHQITQAFGRPVAGGDMRLEFALYEHAFLLSDGREVSLWEVEHTATPDRRHMCEVYPSETAARRAMRERASQAR